MTPLAATVPGVDRVFPTLTAQQVSRIAAPRGRVLDQLRNAAPTVCSGRTCSRFNATAKPVAFMTSGGSHHRFLVEDHMPLQIQLSDSRQYLMLVWRDSCDDRVTDGYWHFALHADQAEAGQGLQ